MSKIDLLYYEKQTWNKGFLKVAGIDEAGRGALAGPVVAAAVIFNPIFILRNINSLFLGINDSKKLSPLKREFFFNLFLKEDILSSKSIIESKKIDQVNILQATHLAMINTAKEITPDFILVDGLPVKNLPCISKNIIKGDSLSISIAAASIIAKVERDKLMLEAHELFPQYGFADNKGYGTRKHIKAIKKYGPSPMHRLSFRPVCEFKQTRLL